MAVTDSLVFAGVVLVVAAGVWLYFYLERRRRDALSALASSMGLNFSKDGPGRYELESTGMEIFRHGHDTRASNMITTAVPGGKMQIFDYSYTTGHGKNRHTRTLTLALITCSCGVPDFDLKPESFIYKLGEMIGFKDIDLPGFPIFSDNYRLTGRNEAAVRVFFTPARAAWFERNPGLHIQGSPGYALLLKSGGRLSVNAWPAFIEEAKIFANEVLK